MLCKRGFGEYKTNVVGAFWRFNVHLLHKYTWRVILGMKKAAGGLKKGIFRGFLVNKCMKCMLYKSEMINFAFGLLEEAFPGVHRDPLKVPMYILVHLENELSTKKEG